MLFGMRLRHCRNHSLCLVPTIAPSRAARTRLPTMHAKLPSLSAVLDPGSIRKRRSSHLYYSRWQLSKLFSSLTLSDKLLSLERTETTHTQHGTLSPIKDYISSMTKQAYNLATMSLFLRVDPCIPIIIGSGINSLEMLRCNFCCPPLSIQSRSHRRTQASIEG